MAKIHEEVYILKVSELLRDGDTPTKFFDNDTKDALIKIVEELVGSGKLVEIGDE
tara:strand:- start:954 stop:1118 length:165 start_codon:yes stop_codon:yes gene_type:complete